MEGGPQWSKEGEARGARGRGQPEGAEQRLTCARAGRPAVRGAYARDGTGSARVAPVAAVAGAGARVGGRRPAVRAVRHAEHAYPAGRAHGAVPAARPARLLGGVPRGCGPALWPLPLPLRLVVLLLLRLLLLLLPRGPGLLLGRARGRLALALAPAGLPVRPRLHVPREPRHLLALLGRGRR